MDCGAKKSFGSVPPFEGLTQVVVGEEYPPGAYFGRGGSTIQHRQALQVFQSNAKFGQKFVPLVVYTYTTICAVTGSVWFRAAAAPSDPCTWSDKIIPVKPGDTVQPGRLTSGLVDREPRVIVGLEDEHGQIDVVYLSSFDFHTVETPTIVHCEAFAPVRWCPPESVW